MHGSEIDTNTPPHLDDALALADLLRPSWGPMQRALRLSGVPLNDGEDEDEVTIKKSEHDELKRSIAEKDKEVRKLSKEQKKTETRIAELEQKLEDAQGGEGEGGDDKTAKALERLEGRLEKEAQKREAAEEKLETRERERTALDVASRLNFRNPGRAVKLLDPDDLETEDSAERALERLAREEPYMVSSKKQRTIDDPKEKKSPKEKKKGSKDEEDPEGKKKGESEDEPVGVERLKRAYDDAENNGGDEGGEGGEGETD